MNTVRSRFGRWFLKLRDTLRYVVSVDTTIDQWNKIALTMVGVGIISVPSIVTLQTYGKKSYNFTDYDKTITSIMRGKVISEIKVTLGDKGMILSFATDLHGKTEYHNEFEYTNAQFQFIPRKGINPKNMYTKGDNMTVILLGLHKVSKRKTNVIPSHPKNV